jgi:hypothetical protein
VKLIEQKTNLFMAYANESAIKDSSQMAADPSQVTVEQELMQLLEKEKDR